jgi:hypothetical protein
LRANKLLLFLLLRFPILLLPLLALPSLRKLLIIIRQRPLLLLWHWQLLLLL